MTDRDDTVFLRNHYDAPIPFVPADPFDVKMWADIKVLTTWLDAMNGRDDTERGMRILSVAGNACEAAAAWIGHKGQNPRKGRAGSAHDVANELADVVITAMVAIESLDMSARLVVQHRLQSVLVKMADVLIDHAGAMRAASQATPDSVERNDADPTGLDLPLTSTTPNDTVIQDGEMVDAWSCGGCRATFTSFDDYLSHANWAQGRGDHGDV